MESVNSKLTDIKINAELIKDAVKRMRSNKGYGESFNQEFNNCLSEINFSSLDDVLSKPISFNLKSGYGAMDKEIKNVETFYKDLVHDINSYKSGCGDSVEYNTEIMKIKQDLYDIFNNYRTKGTKNKKTTNRNTMTSKLEDDYKTKLTSKANLISYMTNDLKKRKSVAKKSTMKKTLMTKSPTKKTVKKPVKKTTRKTVKKTMKKSSSRPTRLLFQSSLSKKRTTKKRTSKSPKKMIY